MRIGSMNKKTKRFVDCVTVEDSPEKMDKEGLFVLKTENSKLDYPITLDMIWKNLQEQILSLDVVVERINECARPDNEYLDLLKKITSIETFNDYIELDRKSVV